MTHIHCERKYYGPFRCGREKSGDDARHSLWSIYKRMSYGAYSSRSSNAAYETTIGRVYWFTCVQAFVQDVCTTAGGCGTPSDDDWCPRRQSLLKGNQRVGSQGRGRSSYQCGPFSSSSTNSGPRADKLTTSQGTCCLLPRQHRKSRETGCCFTLSTHQRS